MPGSMGLKTGLSSLLGTSLMSCLLSSLTSYLGQEVFDLQLLGGMMDGYEGFKTTKKVTDNIAYLVPRNTNIDQPGRSGREGGSGANSAQQEDEDID